MSKAARYQRFAKMCFELAVAFIPVLVVFFIADIIDFNAFVNPKALYLTQDLWDKTGSDFWSAFLFETPFALMRGIIWLFIPRIKAKDRKSTRLNSSHVAISHAVFCLKKKKINKNLPLNERITTDRNH